MTQPKQTWTEWFYSSIGADKVKADVEATASNANAVSEVTRKQARDFFQNASGISYQPTVPRDEFTQALAKHYRHFLKQEGPAIQGYHVLILYDRLTVLGTLYDSIDRDGNTVSRVHINKDHKDCCMAHHKVGRGKGQAGRWGFDVYIFKHGRIHNLGDGTYNNWCWISPNEASFKRSGPHRKEVEFFLA